MFEARRSETVGDGSVAAALPGAAGRWFAAAFPGGPTLIQALAWPAIARGENALLVAPTGTGKTLAAFLAIIDDLQTRHDGGSLAPGLRCVYVSPLRSLSRDIERNLAAPLEGIARNEGLQTPAIRSGLRTGDSTPHQRRKLRERPPHILITTPESLSLLLSQRNWAPIWETVERVIVDEIHSLVPNKRGADLMVSLERLSALTARDPVRLGISATCKPAEPVARFLCGRDRTMCVVDSGSIGPKPPLELTVESLLGGETDAHRPMTYQRMLARLGKATLENRTTVIFANTRAMTEKLTHDLRRHMGRVDPGLDTSRIAAHHSALDGKRRGEVERMLREGELKAVVTSTSLELGVDFATADLAILAGLPGSVSRCLQRIGRAGHSLEATTRGLMLASSPAELAGAAVTARAAREGRIEPLKPIEAPLDVLCQQLIGMACLRDWSEDEAFDLVRRAAPMESLTRRDFGDCLSFLSGQLAAPAGAYESEDSPGPRWSSSRLWRERGHFGIRSSRIVRWFRSNVGTITAEDPVRVSCEGADVGMFEGAYADSLRTGDRFLLDGRAFEFRSLRGETLIARPTSDDAGLPRWTSEKQSLSQELALELSRFRADAGKILETSGPERLKAWLTQEFQLDESSAAVLCDLLEAQDRISEIPGPETFLIEEWPYPEGYAYAFHAPLPRSACEALGRATAARLGSRAEKDLAFVVADLGWSFRISDDRLEKSALAGLLSPDGFFNDVLEGIDRGDLLARRFRHVAGTAMMVLRNPDGRRRRVGGMHWVSTRLYPLVKAACPDHPLLRETQRETLMDKLDAPRALAWLESRPSARLRRLSGPSPLASAWIDPTASELLRFETPAEALRRLRERLVGGRHAG